MVLSTVTAILDWFGVIVFAITGALVASRKQMDLVGFALLGTITGIGGGTIRDVFLGRLPVFWVENPAYLVTCVLVSCLAFFTRTSHSRATDSCSGSMRSGLPCSRSQAPRRRC
jgi:uncharacterized membrane protein YeiH